MDIQHIDFERNIRIEEDDYGDLAKVWITGQYPNKSCKVRKKELEKIKEKIEETIKKMDYADMPEWY